MPSHRRCSFRLLDSEFRILDSGFRILPHTPIHRIAGISFLVLSSLLVLALPAKGGEPDSTAGRDPAFFIRWSNVVPVTLPARGDSLPNEINPDTSIVQGGHLAIVCGAIAATVAGLHIYQENAWWKGQRGSFHVVPDPEYAKNIDKVGHFFGGAFGSFIGTKSMQWSGYSEATSTWLGTAIGGLFELYVEFEDGFARDWGFSPGDAKGDILGALFPIAQYYAKPLRALQPQFQYWPSKEMREGQHPGNIFIDDYDGQTYWIGMHVSEWLPDSWNAWWPKWLGFAVGVSLRGKKAAEDFHNEDLKHRYLLIALDYDWRHILPGDGWFMRTLKEALNFLHFPSPTIRIAPDVVAYGFYFSQ